MKTKAHKENMLTLHSFSLSPSALQTHGAAVHLVSTSLELKLSQGL